MKIICGTCGAKYSLADEKVRGKVFKIHCKKCNELIVVRGTIEGEGGEQPADQTSPAEEDRDSTAAFDPEVDAVWHVLLEGEQQGPYTAEQVAQFINAEQLDAESYCWRDGIGDWVHIKDAPILARILSKAGAEAPAAAPAVTPEEPVAAPAEAPSPSSEPSEEGTSEAYSGFVAPSSPGDEPVAGLFGDVSLGIDPQPSAPAATSSPAAAAPAAADTATAGANLFGAVDAEAGRTAPASAAEGAAVPSPGGAGGKMTGTRNENSVLFSLSNLQALAGPTQEPASAAPASTSPAKSSLAGSGSGLIDIKSLAATQPAAAPSSNIDELIGVSGGFGAEFGGPVLRPMAPEGGSKTLLYALIGVGGAVVLAVVVLVVILVASRPEPTEGVASADQQEQIIIPQSSAQPAESPSEQAAVQPSGTQPITPIEEDAGEAASASTKRGDGAHRQGSKQARQESGEESSGTSSESASSAPASPSAKVGSTALDSLLDGALGSPAGSSPRPTKAARAEPSSDLPDHLNRAQVQGGMNRVAAAVRRCGAGQSGTVMVNVVISGSTGRVTSANVTGNFAGTPVGSCAARAVRGASFPRFQQSSLSVRYPFQVQ